jgi:hypothetical protein
MIMKRAILAGLSAISLSALVATSAIAAPRPATQDVAMNSTSYQGTVTRLGSESLASLAYQGYFRAQGIPGYGALLNAHDAGRVNAKTVVQAAVNAGRLSSTALTDQNYIYQVEVALNGLSNN